MNFSMQWIWRFHYLFHTCVLVTHLHCLVRGPLSNSSNRPTLLAESPHIYLPLQNFTKTISKPIKIATHVPNFLEPNQLMDNWIHNAQCCSSLKNIYSLATASLYWTPSMYIWTGFTLIFTSVFLSHEIFLWRQNKFFIRAAHVTMTILINETKLFMHINLLTCFDELSFSRKWRMRPTEPPKWKMEII